MQSTTLDDTTLRVVPELCAAAIRAGMAAELTCWMVLRHADEVLNQGSGRVRRSVAVRNLSERLAITERRVRQLITSGMGTFWRPGKHDCLYLVGILRLCDILDVRALISRYVTVPHGVISNDLATTKPLISAIAACMFVHPTAVPYIAKACGLSERTMQRHLAEARDVLIVRHNLLVLHQTRSMVEAEMALDAARMSGEHPYASLRIKTTSNGTHCVMREMPNTYDFASGRASYGKLRYRLKRRRGVVEKKGHADGSRRPMAQYKKMGIMNLVDISGWHGPITDMTEVWQQNVI